MPLLLWAHQAEHWLTLNTETQQSHCDWIWLPLSYYIVTGIWKNVPKYQSEHKPDILIVQKQNTAWPDWCSLKTGNVLCSRNLDIWKTRILTHKLLQKQLHDLTISLFNLVGTSLNNLGTMYCITSHFMPSLGWITSVYYCPLYYSNDTHSHFEINVYIY